MKAKYKILSIAIGVALGVTAMTAVAKFDSLDKFNDAEDQALSSAGYAQPDSKIQHVLLISVDGLHQNDLDWV